MISNNGLMTYKNKYLSFINKFKITSLLCLALVILLPCSYFVFEYWYEMPVFMKIFWPILIVITLIGTLITPFNGMIILRNGKIFFVPDFRLIKTNVQILERISFTFNEWENNKYSVKVKFVYKDGDFFIKDYSKQFRNMKNKKLAMSMYTITKTQVDKICRKLSDMEFCVISIINYQ
jgi:hypothetical protein